MKGEVIHWCFYALLAAVSCGAMDIHAQNLVVDQELSATTKVFTASESILATASIVNNSNITFRAANSIALKQGFKVEKGSFFKAVLDASLSTGLTEPKANNALGVSLVFKDGQLNVLPIDGLSNYSYVEVVSMTGKIVAQQKFTAGQSIPVANIPIGIYIVKLTGFECPTISTKIVVR